MFTFLLPLFLVFLASVSASAAFQVTVPSNLVAGGTGAVTWTRNLIIDPHKFTLSLRAINSDDDDALPSVTVDSQGEKTGQETFTFPEAGTFKISAFPNIGLNLNIVPFESSDQFLVARAPPPQTQSPPGQDPGDGGPGKGGGGPPPPPQTTFSESSTSSSSTTSSTTQVTRSLTTQSTTRSLTTQESSSSSSITSTSVQSTSSESPSVSGTETQTTIGQSTQPGYDSNVSVTDTNTSGNVNPTTPVATGSISSSSNAGAIAGGIVGALMVIVVIVLLIYVCRRRARRRRKTTFFRDMMVRRRSEGLVFSQVTIPSMWTYPNTDVEKQSEGNHSASAHGQVLRDSFSPAQSTRTNTTSISTVNITAAPSRSLDIQDAPWTERQIAVHDTIVDLQAKLLAKQSWSMYNEETDGYDVDELRRKIERLEGIMQSSWALGFTDDIPDGLE